MGRTTSTAPRVAGALAAGTGNVSATEPSPLPSSQRPSRPMATVTTSYSTGSRDSSTERAEASEISCSDDRPPARMATFSRLIGRPAAYPARERAEGERRSSAALWPMSGGRGVRGNREVPPSLLEEGSWGKHGFPHGSEPKASDAHGGPGVAANLPTAIVTVVPGGC